MASTTPSSASMEASRAAAIRSVVSSLVINGALPFVIYWFVTTFTSTSPFVALVITGIPSLIDSIVGMIRRKHLDLLAGIVLTGIVISLILIALGSNPKVYLIRESFFTVAFGLACLVSLFLPRPIMFYFSRHFASGNDPANVARFNALWQYEGFRHAMRVTSAVWGIGFLLEATIRIYLVLTLNVAQFLAISPFVIYGIIAILVIWTFNYSRAGRQRSAEMMKRMAEEEQAASASSPTESA